MYAFLGEISIWIFFPFRKCVVISLLSCKASLDVPHRLFIWYLICKYFLPFSLWFVFLFLWSCPLKILLLIKSNLSIFFLLLFMLLMSYAKNYCQNKCQGASSLCFLLGVLWYQVFCLSFNSSWVNFCEWYKRSSFFFFLLSILPSFLPSLFSLSLSFFFIFLAFLFF